MKKIRILINLIIAILFPILASINDIFTIFMLSILWLAFIANGIMFIKHKGITIFSIFYNIPKDILEKYYDTKAYLLFEGWLLIILSLGLLVSIAGIYFHINWLMFSGFGYILLIFICSLIYSKLGKRFRK